MASERYTCWGSVRRGCGKRHRTIEAARRCCGVDDSGVTRGHGRTAYSDRSGYVIDRDATINDVRCDPPSSEIA